MLTTSSTFALQFYWHGYDAYVKFMESDSIAGCFYRSQCDDSKNEYFKLIPVQPQTTDQLADGMNVYIKSAGYDCYIRAGRVSKYLRWSRTSDEQCVFRIQTSDRQPLTSSSQFVIAHNSRKDYFVGFSQTLALGASKNMQNAIGCLTLGKKKKNHVSLIFPIRFRAVQKMNGRNGAQSDEMNDRASVRRSLPIVTAADITYVIERDFQVHNQIPLARVVSIEPERTEGIFWESCPYCGMFFNDLVSFESHKRYTHNEDNSSATPDAVCLQCGHTYRNGRCHYCS